MEPGNWKYAQRRDDKKVTMPTNEWQIVNEFENVHTTFLMTLATLQGFSPYNVRWHGGVRLCHVDDDIGRINTTILVVNNNAVSIVVVRLRSDIHMNLQWEVIRINVSEMLTGPFLVTFKSCSRKIELSHDRTDTQSQKNHRPIPEKSQDKESVNKPIDFTEPS